MPNIKGMKKIALAMTSLGLSTSSFADISPASMFTDNMVLQRSMAVPVWGKAAPGETVTVSFANNERPPRQAPTGAGWSTSTPWRRRSSRAP